jgi:hypothetical protein
VPEAFPLCNGLRGGGVIHLLRRQPEHRR